jgi:hypothetical protein
MGSTDIDISYRRAFEILTDPAPAVSDPLGKHAAA